LLTAPLKNASTNTLVKQYIYAYDLAANRTSERVGNQTTSSTPNNVNEITSQSGATNRTLTYDLDGSLTSDGSTRTFEWDAANRLVAINYTGTTLRSEFLYDGLNRCSKIVEKNNGAVNSVRSFVWCGTDKCEFRNGSNAVQFQLYAQGQYQNGATYFYTRDHLGSIREMTDASGTVVARYDYDPWGRSTTVIGTTKPDFNFTGLYQHAKSGLDLAMYRVYDPNLGRWLSRDPIGENDGNNLYAYVRNRPASATDPLGLFLEVLFFAEEPPILPPDLVDAATRLQPPNAGNRVNLPDGRAVDLPPGRAHGDIDTPHTHQPQPPFEPPYQNLFRPPNPNPVPSSPQDIQDVINFLKGYWEELQNFFFSPDPCNGRPSRTYIYT
jgi:RHS repeat-associated protein